MRYHKEKQDCSYRPLLFGLIGSSGSCRTTCAVLRLVISELTCSDLSVDRWSPQSITVRPGGPCPTSHTTDCLFSTNYRAPSLAPDKQQQPIVAVVVIANRVNDRRQRESTKRQLFDAHATSCIRNPVRLAGLFFADFVGRTAP